MPIDLFTTFAERVMDRVDEVLSNRECKWPPSENQRMLLGMLKAHRGVDRAMPLSEICGRMKLAPRVIKDLVQDLRLNFRVQIGASREANGGGYFLGTNREEMAQASQQMFQQALSMLRVVKVLRSEHNSDDMIQQIRHALIEEGTDAR